jgi:choline kinase
LKGILLKVVHEEAPFGETTLSAVILAAGLGRRLKILTAKLPKALLPLSKSLTILDTQMLSLTGIGIRNFVIVVGYKMQMIKEYLEKHYCDSDCTFRYVFNPLYENSNTAYSLWLSLKDLKGNSLVVNGDLMLTKHAAALVHSGIGSCIGVSTRSIDKEAVKVRIDNDGLANYLGKRLAVSKSYGEYLGIAKMHSTLVSEYVRIFDELMCMNKVAALKAYYDDIFNSLCHKNRIYVADLSAEPVIEVDTLSDLESARRMQTK